MILNKIKSILAATSVVCVLAVTPAVAASYTSGYSSGGSRGSVSCNGSISVGSGAYGSYKYYATGATNSNDSSGLKAVHVLMHFSDSSSKAQDYSGYSTSVSGSIYSAYKPVYGYARHSYSSSAYGSWYGSTTAYY